jgi:hypothetical protein
VPQRRGAAERSRTMAISAYKYNAYKYKETARGGLAVNVIEC